MKKYLDTLLLLMSIILLMMIYIKIQSVEKVNIVSNESACRDACLLLYNTPKYFIDGYGNCICTGKMYILSENGSWEIKLLKNLGVVLSVQKLSDNNISS